MASADFNDDGDYDVILGRSTAQGRYYHAQRDQNEDDPANNWLGVVFRPTVNGTFTPARAIGAQVKISSGSTTLGMGIVDGGSGRGSQMPRRLVFGLGDAVSPFTVIADWANGSSTTWDVSSVNETVVLERTITIDRASISGSIKFRPDMTVDWVFNWNTDSWSDVNLAEVDITHIAGEGCAFVGKETLQATDSHVTASVVLAGGVYKHKMTWWGQTCYEGCQYRFKVRSSNGISVETQTALDPGDRMIDFSACPLSY